MLTNLYLLCGIPGSGKTTWARHQIKSSADILLSRDEVRFALLEEGEEYFNKEKTVFKLWVNQIIEAINNENIKNIYADATHLNEASRNNLLSKLPQEKIKVINVVFLVPLSICLERNAQRTGRALVPQDVIENMWKRFNPPKRNVITINEKGEMTKCNLGKVFVTSDLHFGHDKEFLWKPRGFASVEEMNQTIVKNWNSVVSAEDHVYILGDLMLGSLDNINWVRQLNGNLHIVLGNHDTDQREKEYMKLENVVEIACAIRFKYNKYHFFLTHFPCITDNLNKECLQQATLNLFGHTHQKTKFFEERPYMYHVGMDAHNCYPVEIETIIKDMKNKIKDCVEYL